VVETHRDLDIWKKKSDLVTISSNVGVLKSNPYHVVIAQCEDHMRIVTVYYSKEIFFAIYKQSFIGILWALIIPLVSVGTFIILNRSGVFTIGDINVPYPIYAIFL